MMPTGASSTRRHPLGGAAPDDPSWLAHVYDGTAWYWDSFVHALVYGRAYRRLFERLREDGWASSGPSRVLDCGIGAGVLAEAFVRALGGAATVYGVDLSARLLTRAAMRLARRRVPLRACRADARALPIADAQMDAVLCGLVLDHLSDPAAAIRELARVARPGAPILLVTTSPSAPDLPFRVVFRYRRPRPDVIEEGMLAAGLHGVRRHALTGVARPFAIAFTARRLVTRGA